MTSTAISFDIIVPLSVLIGLYGALRRRAKSMYGPSGSRRPDATHPEFPESAAGIQSNRRQITGAPLRRRGFHQFHRKLFSFRPEPRKPITDCRQFRGYGSSVARFHPAARTSGA